MKLKASKKLLKILLFLITFIISLAAVSAIGTNDVVFNSSAPANDTWTNQEFNFTEGFQFYWNDSAPLAYVTANCSLYIQPHNSSEVVAARNFFNSLTVANATPTTIYMAKNFTVANVRQFWTIECFNESATPTSFAPTPRALRIDTTVPLIREVDKNFVNNTWLNISSGNTVRIQINVTDNISQSMGGTMTCELFNATKSKPHDSNSVSLSESDLVGTNNNLTFDAADGNYTFGNIIRVACNDSAGNQNISNGRLYNYTFYVDTTAAVIALVTPTPSNDSVLEENFVHLNFTVVEENLNSIVVNFNGTVDKISIALNCTGTRPNYNCKFNTTTLVDEKDMYYNITVNDTADNQVTTVLRLISLDNSPPQVPAVLNFTLSSSVGSYNFTVNDTTPDTCAIRIYKRNGSLQVQKAGTLGTTLTDKLTTYCTGTFNATDIDNSSRSAEGEFLLESVAVDELGRNATSSSNITGIIHNLFAGWNLYTWTGPLNNASTLCDEVNGCSQVSKRDNAANAKSYTTFSTSTPSVNNGTAFNPGEAFYLFSSITTFGIMLEDLPDKGDATENITLADHGWNTFGLLNNASIHDVINATSLLNSTHSYPTTTSNITYGSSVNSSAGKYYTCRKTINLCTATTQLATQIFMPKGYALWVKTDGNVTINRTKIGGFTR